MDPKGTHIEESRPLRVAMIGSKGLPALFGGIERHVEETGRRLAERGHEVTVFGRKPFCEDMEYLGMKIRALRSIPTKNLDTATNTLTTCVKTLSEPFDIYHFHGIGPSIFIWIPGMAGRRTVSTVHALDYRQSKWGGAARFLLRMGERRAALSADAVISVSRLMADQLSRRYSREIDYIPNGANISDPPPFSIGQQMGIESGRYILTVGRFIVERGFHTLLEAFSGVDTDMRLLIVGDERFEKEYAGSLHRSADDRVVFPGYVSGSRLDELYAHCAFYVLPSLVEGLPISLMEAMSFARPVLVSDIPENLEVTGGTGHSFRAGDAGDLRRGLERMIGMDPAEAEESGSRGKARISAEYDWDRITDDIEKVYYRIMEGG
ncbi:MAG TPA: glycosyltransferase family 4 protein [Candidatus Krumholzibacterium sp.]|nr:glycosyltransferase family 4 protein [Candidatus Krumholzibacterium sp.]